MVAAVKKTADDKLKSELQDLGRRIREARRGVIEFLQQTPENTCIGLSEREKPLRTDLECSAGRYLLGSEPDRFFPRIAFA